MVGSLDLGSEATGRVEVSSGGCGMMRCTSSTSFVGFLRHGLPVQWSPVHSRLRDTVLAFKLQNVLLNGRELRLLSITFHRSYDRQSSQSVQVALSSPPLLLASFLIFVYACFSCYRSPADTFKFAFLPEMHAAHLTHACLIILLIISLIRISFACTLL